MAGGQAERKCYCIRCSKYPRGFLSVSYATYKRHNILGEAPPPNEIVIPSQDMVLPIPAGETLEEFPATNSNLSTPYDLQKDASGIDDEDLVDADLDAELDIVEPEFGDNVPGWWGPEEASDDDNDGNYPLSPVHEHHPQKQIQFDHGNQAGDVFDYPQPLKECLQADVDLHHHLDPAVRFLYTTIAFGKATGMSVSTANTQLDGMTTAVELARGSILDGQTGKVKTVLSRLGVNPDDYNDRYIVCPNVLCWEFTPYKQLYTIPAPACIRCGTRIYRRVNHIRTPFKVIPYSRLSVFLSLRLQDPSIHLRLNDWREPGIDDDEENTDPLDQQIDYRHPEQLLHGLSDGTAWRAAGTNQERVIWEDDSVSDEPIPNCRLVRHVALPGGLQIVLNCDWFAVKGLIGSSVGAIYATIANLPRDIAFKRRNTALLTVIPGPKEPGPTCFSKVLDPIVEDLKRCESGFLVNMGGVPTPISCQVLLSALDLLAAKKLVGAVSHAHRLHPCHHCAITKADINLPIAYAWDSLPHHDPGTLLKACFRHEAVDATGKADIEETYGVRYSPLMKLIGHEHAASTPVDPLHNSFLGIAKSLVNMLFQRGLFEGKNDVGRDRRDMFCSVFESANYPGHLGRLPARVTKQFASDRKLAGSGLKADQWKRIIQLLPLALFIGFREADDGFRLEDLPEHSKNDQRPPGRRARRSDTAPPGDGNPVYAPGRRSRPQWYRVALLISSALSILHAHSISVKDAEDATKDLASASVGIIALGGHLTINWHIAMHYPEFVKLYGPLAGYGTWAFERNNGALAKVKHNGQERDVPTTLLRSWLLEARLWGVIFNPAPDAGDIERQGLKSMVASKDVIRGTLMLDEARGNRANRTIRLPAPFQRGLLVDLAQHAAYTPLLRYLQSKYPALDIVDVAYVGKQDRFCLPNRSQAYSIFTHANHNGFKFCSTLWSRSRRDQFGLAISDPEFGQRDLCKIYLFLKVDLPLPGRGGRLDLQLALVEFYQPTEGVYPWGGRDIDLGYRSYRNCAYPPCIIPIAALESSTIVAPVRTTQDGDCLISISCDRDGQEPEFWLDAEEEVEAGITAEIDNDAGDD